MKKGKLIVIEGGDAAGKATQVALLTTKLIADGVPVIQMDFPQYGRNHVGQLLRECLDGKHGDFIRVDPKIASVLYSVDRLESKDELLQALNDGKVVLLDRYSTANVLHQGAKVSDRQQRFETMQWIYKLEHDILGLPVPDLVLTLPVPAAVRAGLRAQQNRTKGRLIDLADQDQVHQQLVDETLGELAQIYSEVISIKTMDGDDLRPPEYISEHIFQIVHGIL
jgi:dTMP kinase